MRRSFKNAVGKQEFNVGVPPEKRVRVHYERDEVSNSSFANDVTRCDITFCIAKELARETQDIDVKTDGTYVKEDT